MLKHPAACKVSVSKGRSGWCGSGTLCGFDTVDGVEGGWVLSNAHVLPSVGQYAEFRFHTPAGDKNFGGRAKYVAYSNNYQIDWAFAFVPGLTKEIGIEPVKLSKSRPAGRKFHQTGSPRCVWPLTAFECTLHDIIQSQRVYRWSPKSIGGQSGSSLRNTISGLIELLLTWSWGNYGAGQPTYLIWISKTQKSSEVGFKRVPGLIEVAQDGDTPIQERGIQAGYFSGPEEMDSVQELPVWEGDIDPGDDPDDPTPPDTIVRGVPIDAMMAYLKSMNATNNKFLKLLESLPAEGELIIDPDKPPKDEDDESDGPFFGYP